MKVNLLELLGSFGNLTDRVAVGLRAHAINVRVHELIVFPFAAWWNIF